MSVVDTLAVAIDSPAIPWKTIFYTGLGIHAVFLTWLDWRHSRVLNKSYLSLSPSVRSLVDEPTYDRTRAYSLAKLRLGIIETVIDLAINGMAYYFDVLPRAWKVAAAWSGGRQFVATMVFFGLMQVCTSAITIPLKVYRTFVLEERFGFNKMTAKTFILDFVKSTALLLTLGTPLMAAAVSIIDRFGRSFIGWIMLFIVAINVLGVIIVPTVIQPLFNKFEPLEDGKLRTAIGELATKLGFPMSQVYIMDGSTRSAHSNAYFTGLPYLPKRIVLFDTLVKNHSVENVVAVIAHEMGHWRKNHIIQLFVVSLSQVLLQMLLLAGFLGNRSLYKQLGFPSGQMPTVVALSVFMDSLTPISALLQFFSNWVTRSAEYDADRFAVKNGYGERLAESLTTMQKTDLATVEADWLYSTYHYSHPILPERLAAINAAVKKSG